MCECGEVENTSHLFLHYNHCGQLRHNFLNRVSTFCQPTVSFNFLSKPMRATFLSESFFVVRYMKVVYLTTARIQIKPYTICSSLQLGSEVERPERSTTFSFFLLFYTIKEIFLVFRQFFQPPYTEP